MIMDAFSWVLIILHSILIIVLFGILCLKYFGKNFRNKSDIGAFFLIVVFWSIFFFSGAYGMVVSPGVYSVVASIVSFVLTILLFVYLIFKYYYLVDFWLMIPEFCLFAFLGILIFVDRYAYEISLSKVILGVVSIATWFGYFMVIRFLIKREGGL